MLGKRKTTDLLNIVLNMFTVNARRKQKKGNPGNIHHVRTIHVTLHVRKRSTQTKVLDTLHQTKDLDMLH
jgi:hypothetical protein